MNEYTCAVPTGPWQGAPGTVVRDDTCASCGAPVELHPVRICADCAHRVDFHGEGTDGCSRIVAGDWCSCRATFGRPDPVG